MNGNALSLRNTDQNLAQFMEKKPIIILVATIKKQIRKSSESESALHQNTPQYCIC